MTPTETEFGDGQYLRTLGVHPHRPVARYDGAHLFEVPPIGGPLADHPYVPAGEINVKRDRHFIVLACDMHDEHHGHRELVRQLLPNDWVCFAQFTHPQQGFSAYHYGPAWPTEETT